jgi:hypothetical protein
MAAAAGLANPITGQQLQPPCGSCRWCWRYWMRRPAMRSSTRWRGL